jgi:hypothetical protein
VAGAGGPGPGQVIGSVNAAEVDAVSASWPGSCASTTSPRSSSSCTSSPRT